MDKEPRFPGFKAELPPRVRYDKELPPAAKLLFAEITAMTDTTGFCWASNDYLGRLMNLSKDRASRLLALLQSRGYLDLRVIRDEKNIVISRHIYVTDYAWSALPPPVNFTGRGPVKNTGRPPGKNNDKNGIKEERPPYSPPKGTRVRHEHKAAPDWKPEAFAQLWVWYPTGEIAMHQYRGNKQKAIRAWDKLHPSDELIDVIAAALARQAQSEQWSKGVGITHLSTYLNNYGWEGWETA